MNICFRVDASTKIGTGHVMRCLTLADKLRGRGHTVTFACRIHEGHLCKLITSKGFTVLQLKEVDSHDRFTNDLKHAGWLGIPQKEDVMEMKKLFLKKHLQFDWIIIDHYAIDKMWEQAIREYIPNIMVIDDIADREHDCDILLDQNYYLDASNRYSDLVSDKCISLLGPKYALLRDEFIKLHNVKKKHSHQKSALVFYGGSDPTNETIIAVNAIKELNYKNLITHVLIGPSNPNKDIIKDQCNQRNITFHYNIDYVAELIHKVDFAICAGGSTTWERYCVGTPAILSAIAYNQIELCENVQHLGIDQYIGISKNVTQQMIKNKVEYFLNNDVIHQLNKKAIRVVDGKGKVRVSEVLESTNN